MGRPLVSIIWLNYNSMHIIDIVLRSLQGIFNLDYPSIELIIVDNGSTDGSFKVIKEFVNQKRPGNIKIKIIRLERNLGFAGGVNYGYRAVSKDSKYLVLLNNDAIPLQHSLSELVEILELDKRLGAVQGIILRPDGKIDSAGDLLSELLTIHTPFRGESPGSVKWGYYITYADGSYSIYRIDALRKGLKDPSRLLYDFTFAYFDDNYLGLKLWNNGFRVALIPIISAIHVREATFKKARAFQRYLGRRSHIILNEISNSRYKDIVRIIMIIKNTMTCIGHIRSSEYIHAAYRSVRDGILIGKILRHIYNEYLNLYKAPIVKIPLWLVPLYVLSPRDFFEIVNSQIIPEFIRRYRLDIF